MNILVIGGAGYVGSSLVPRLLKDNKVTVYDNYCFGYRFKNHKNLTQINGDIRDKKKLDKAFKNIDIVYQLACLSNDSCSDLDPYITYQINYRAFENIIGSIKKHKVKQLIQASSATLYGFKEEICKETTQPNPITLYGVYKLGCEYLLKEQGEDFIWTILRPGTLSGYSPRMRFDLVVNMFAAQAIENKKIIIYGGKQIRPLLNLQDMVDLYEKLSYTTTSLIDKQIFNIAYDNLSVEDIAIKISNHFECDIEYTSNTDNRSYTLDSNKIKRVFVPKYNIEEAIDTISNKYKEGILKDVFKNPIYYNVKVLRELWKK
jgi:nucleoside-diphosphate-sugar epimerase